VHPHDVEAGGVRAHPELVQQGALAEAARPVHEQHAVGRLPGESGIEAFELVRPADERTGARGVDDGGQVLGRTPDHAPRLGAARMVGNGSAGPVS
jgi:hypothetical protein